MLGFNFMYVRLLRYLNKTLLFLRHQFNKMYFMGLIYTNSFINIYYYVFKNILYCLIKQNEVNV
jgi:hypothetical protein